MSKHILLMEGPDAKGLIFNVTSVLYKNECNIFKQDEYVSPNGWFYMRTEFESNNGYEPEKVLQDLRKVIPNEEIRKISCFYAQKNIIVYLKF